MPYNLRKRKVAEPVEKEEVRKRKVTEPAKQEARKRKATEPVKPAARKRKTIEPVKDEEEPPKSIVAEPVKEDEQEAPKVVASEPVKEEKVKKIKFDGNLFMFGVDGCGELGMGKIGITRKNPKPVPIDVPIKQVACGPCHTLALTESGSIYSFGCNDEGALGRVTDGDEALESTPTIIEMAGEVTKITTGDSHGAALTKENQVFIWGNFRDEHGSTGLLPECKGDKTFKPIQVMPEKKFQDIASGGNHMLLLDTDGVVYSFGVGAQGQLGRLSSEEAAKPLADNRDIFLTPMVVSMKNVDPSREFICDAIYAGEHSSFATNTDKKKNRLAGWGLNNRYQLGYKGQKGQLIQYYPRRSTFTCSTSMINVACGQHHTLFLTKTGRVYACGLNEYGRLGIGDGMKDKKEICPSMHLDNFDSPVTDISAKINTSFAVTSSGKLYAWGSNDGPHLGVDEESGDLMLPTEVEKLAAHKVISVETGGTFTAVIVEY